MNKLFFFFFIASLGGTASGQAATSNNGSSEISNKTNGALNPLAYAGSNLSAQMLSAYNSGDCPTAPQTCVLHIPTGKYAGLSAVKFGTRFHPVTIECDAGTTLLKFTNTSGPSITFDWGWGTDPVTQHPGTGSGMRGCALFGNGGTSSGIEVAGPNGGIGVQALIENNFIQGFGTGIDGNAPGHSGFLITIRGNTIQGNATGIDFSPAAGDGLENARVENNNISNNNTGIITTGPSVEVSILGNSFDANSVNAINATNSIIYADNNHFENPDLTSPTEYVLFNGGSMVIHGGWMMERRTSGTYPWMIRASGFGTLVVDSPYLSSAGGTVSNFVTVSGTTISPVLNVMLPSGFANLFSVPNGVTPGLYGLSGLQSGNGKVSTAIANSQAASMNVDGASNVTFKLGSSPFLTRTASNYVLSGNNIPILTSFTTSSAEGDNVTVTGMTAKGHCSSPTATNSIATTITGIYISGKTTNRITVNHSVKAGGTFDISCTPN